MIDRSLWSLLRQLLTKSGTKLEIFKHEEKSRTSYASSLELKYPHDSSNETNLSPEKQLAVKRRPCNSTHQNTSKLPHQDALLGCRKLRFADTL